MVRIENLSKSGGSFPSLDPPTSSAICDTGKWTDATTTYHCYDEFERLVTSQEPSEDAEPTYLVYDGLDRRDLKILGAGGESKVRELPYLGTSQRLSREKTKDGSKTETYDYDSRGLRAGQRQKTSSADTFSSYAIDAAGSVSALEDRDGEIAEQSGAEATYTYDPYGELVHTTPADGQTPEQALPQLAKDNPFRFQSFYYDSGIRSYDMLAREYRPEVGRFLTQDRFEAAGLDQLLDSDPLTQNRYVFAGGNPVSRIEWDGHFGTGHEDVRLAGALLIEQNDEWLVGRRYLSAESIALVLEDQGDEEREEVKKLQAA